MTKPNYNEADTVRKGLATIAVQDGASAGDVASVNASGELELVAQSGGGGSSSLSVLGPFTLNYNDPGAGTTVKLADLAAGTLVLQVIVLMQTKWADAGNQQHDLKVGVGGPDWADPDQDWWPLHEQPLDVNARRDAGSGAGWGTVVVDPGAQSGASLLQIFGTGGRVGDQDGALVAFVTDAAAPSQGGLDIYAVVHVPT